MVIEAVENPSLLIVFELLMVNMIICPLTWKEK